MLRQGVLLNYKKDIIVFGNYYNYRVSFYKGPLRCALKGFFVFKI